MHSGMTSHGIARFIQGGHWCQKTPKSENRELKVKCKKIFCGFGIAVQRISNLYDFCKITWYIPGKMALYGVREYQVLNSHLGNWDALSQQCISPPVMFVGLLNSEMRKILCKLIFVWPASLGRKCLIWHKKTLRYPFHEIMTLTCCFIVVNIYSLQLQVRVPMVGSSRINSMLIRNHLPELENNQQCTILG